MFFDQRPCSLLVRHVGVFFGLALACATEVSAQLTPARTAVEEGPQVFDWRQTARLEHEDRKARFVRLAAQGLIASPVFYEALIKKRELRAFGVDIPVLRLVFPQRVFFDTDKSEVRPEALHVIELVAQDLRKDVPDVALFVAGHTDARGSDEYNYLLSVDRADAVARALYTRGIGSAKLWRVGFGKAVPIKPNTSVQNMAENRRVEFLFAARPEAIAVWLSKQADIVCKDKSQQGGSSCRRQFAALPPFVAVPVLNEKTGVVTPEESAESISREDARDAVAGPDGKRSEINVNPDRPTVIEKSSTVIINLNEKRVTVGRPVL